MSTVDFIFYAIGIGVVAGFVFNLLFAACALAYWKLRGTPLNVEWYREGFTFGVRVEPVREGVRD